VLDRLLTRDRLAELHALAGVARGDREGLLGRAEAVGAQRQAAAVEGRHRDLEAVADGAEAIGIGHAHLVEMDLDGAAAALAHLVLGLARTETGHLLLDDEGRDPAPRAELPIVGGEDHDQVGHIAVGDPDLGAVEDPVLALACRGRAHGPGVAAAVGLGQGVAGELLAFAHRRQPALLLLVGAIEQDRVATDRHVPTGPDRRREATARDLLHEDAQTHLAHAAPAELLGEVHAKHAHFLEPFGHRVRDLLLVIDLRGERLQLALTPIANGLAQHLLLFGEGEFHDGRLSAGKGAASGRLPKNFGRPMLASSLRLSTARSAAGPGRARKPSLAGRSQAPCCPASYSPLT
jgi:hypothetical protein